jgi:hypothetical protein
MIGRCSVGEGYATLGIDVQAPCGAPSGERGRIEFSSDQDPAFMMSLLSDFFDSHKPIIIGARQLEGILKQGHELSIVGVVPVPDDPGNLLHDDLLFLDRYQKP